MGAPLAIIAAAAMSAPHPVPAIVGGGPAAATHTAPLALIVEEGPGGETLECSGTLVAPDLVLTAGHCADQRSASRIRVTLGANRDRRSVFHAAASRVVLAPGFDAATLAHDAALVVLARVSHSERETLTQAAPATGETVTLVGWGQHEALQLDAQSEAREASVTVLAQSDCEAASRQLGTPFYAEQESCGLSATRSAGACHGDSGGPVLLADGAQAALVSHGDGNCSTADPTFLERVPTGWLAGWREREAHPPLRPGVHRVPLAGGQARVTVAPDGESAERVTLDAKLRCSGETVRVDVRALAELRERSVRRSVLRLELPAHVAGTAGHVSAVLPLGSHGTGSVWLGRSLCTAEAGR